jgi:hypothetical protein
VIYLEDDRGPEPALEACRTMGIPPKPMLQAASHIQYDTPLAPHMLIARRIVQAFNNTGHEAGLYKAGIM